MSTITTTITTTARKPRVVFVLGGPGAGKGTQCANIVQQYGWVHLSAGDLLREARLAGGELGNMIEHYIKEGLIVPVEVTVNLIRAAMEEQMKNANKFDFLVDGFPRNDDNLSGWQKIMGDFANVLFVLFFDCPEEVMEARLLERGKSSGRVDDTADSIRKRFVTYTQSTMPIIHAFASEGKVRKINATTSVEEVFEQVRVVFDAIISS